MVAQADAGARISVTFQAGEQALSPNPLLTEHGVKGARS
jgi:hypothetical protein